MMAGTVVSSRRLFVALVLVYIAHTVMAYPGGAMFDDVVKTARDEMNAAVDKLRKRRSGLDSFKGAEMALQSRVDTEVDSGAATLAEVTVPMPLSENKQNVTFGTATVESGKPPQLWMGDLRQPIVFAAPVTSYNQAPVNLAMYREGDYFFRSDVTKTCEKNDALTDTEMLSYIALEDRIVTDDYETFNERVRADEWTTIALERDHGVNPFVFACPQTRNNPFFSTVRVAPTGESDHVSLRVQTDAASEFSAKGFPEDVGLLVFKSDCGGEEIRIADHSSPRCGVGGADGNEPGSKTLRRGVMTLMGTDRKFELALALTTPGDMQYQLQEYSFVNQYERPPLVLAQVLSQRGTQPVYVRQYDTTVEKIRWGLDQENCADPDRSHPSEYVALLAIEPPPPPSPSPSPSAVPTPSPISPSPTVTPTISVSASVTPPPGSPDNPARCQSPPNGVIDPECPMGTVAQQKLAQQQHVLE